MLLEVFHYLLLSLSLELISLKLTVVVHAGVSMKERSGKVCQPNSNLLFFFFLF